MKILLLIFVVLLATNIFASGQVEDSKNFDYSIDNFTGIECLGAFDIVVEKSDTYSIVLSVAPSIKDKIIIEKKGNNLYLGRKKNVEFFAFKKWNVKVTISMPSLTEVKLAGSSSLVANSKFEETDFLCNATGSSDVKVNIATNKCDIKLSGSSNFRGSVTADDIAMKLTGSSDINIEGTSKNITAILEGSSDAVMEKFIITNQGDIILSGSSNMGITINGTLNLTASGASDLVYSGTVILGEMKLTGASKITQK